MEVPLTRNLGNFSGMFPLTFLKKRPSFVCWLRRATQPRFSRHKSWPTFAQPGERSRNGMVSSEATVVVEDDDDPRGVRKMKRGGSWVRRTLSAKSLLNILGGALAPRDRSPPRKRHRTFESARSQSSVASLPVVEAAATPVAGAGASAAAPVANRAIRTFCMVGRLRSPRGRIAPRAGPTPAPRLLSRALFFGAPPRSRAVGRAELSERRRRPLRWSRMAATDAQRPGCVRRRVSRLSGDVDIADFASRVVPGAAERRVCRSGLIAANLQLICPKRSSPCSPRRGRRGGPRRPTDAHKGKKNLGGKPVLCV